jgi:thioredoxin-dependent peroxiredoxin
MSKPQAGQPAPEFELPDQNGKTVRLSDFRGQRSVVLFFYPKDDTTGCTQEACGFRDSLPEFQSRGAEVIGISSDSVESHARFAAKYKLPFTLLSDRKGRVRKLYGASGPLAGLIPGRVTLVIDREGIVRHVFSSMTQFRQHVTEALAAAG